MDKLTERMYILEISHLNKLIEQLTFDKCQLKEALRRYIPRNKSTQVARLFMPKNQW